MISRCRGMVPSAAIAVVAGRRAGCSRRRRARRDPACPAEAASRPAASPATGRPPARADDPPRRASPRPPAGRVHRATSCSPPERRVFLGQAAHCAGTERATPRPTAAAPPAGPLGTPVTIHGSDGPAAPATLAYSSWVDDAGRPARPTPTPAPTTTSRSSSSSRTTSATSTRACRSSAARPAWTRTGSARASGCSATATRLTGSASTRSSRWPGLGRATSAARPEVYNA